MACLRTVCQQDLLQPGRLFDELFQSTLAFTQHCHPGYMNVTLTEATIDPTPPIEQTGSALWLSNKIRPSYENVQVCANLNVTEHYDVDLSITSAHDATLTTWTPREFSVVIPTTAMLKSGIPDCPPGTNVCTSLPIHSQKLCTCAPPVLR